MANGLWSGSPASARRSAVSLVLADLEVGGIRGVATLAAPGYRTHPAGVLLDSAEL